MKNLNIKLLEDYLKTQVKELKNIISITLNETSVTVKYVCVSFGNELEEVTHIIMLFDLISFVYSKNSVSI